MPELPHDGPRPRDAQREANHRIPVLTLWTELGYFMRDRFRILFAYKASPEVVDSFKTRRAADEALAEYRLAFAAALAAGALLWLEGT